MVDNMVLQRDLRRLEELSFFTNPMPLGTCIMIIGENRVELYTCVNYTMFGIGEH